MPPSAESVGLGMSSKVLSHPSMLPTSLSYQFHRGTKTKFMHPSYLQRQSGCHKIRAVHIPATILPESSLSFYTVRVDLNILHLNFFA